MNVTATETGTWRRTLEIEAPPESVAERLEEAYRSYSKTIDIPGFRKGKVPVAIVKKRFGKAIEGEVVQKMVEEFYREASQSEGLHPVSEATIEDLDYSEGQPLKFKASVDVKPEPKPEKVKGLKAVRRIFPVKDDQLEEHLAFLQDQQAAETVVERPAELGDVLVADIQELDESGVAIVGRRQEGRTFHLGGPHSTNHDLNNQLVGISVGDSRSVVVRAGEDARDEVAGKEVRFEVRPTEIRGRVIPDLDDEFAKDLGEFESLDALKKRIQDDFNAQSEQASRQSVNQSVVEELIRSNDFEVPDAMVENYLDSMVESYKKEHAGHDHAIDEDAIRKEGRDSALLGVKRYLLLEAIAEQESLEVSDEDVDAHLSVMGAQYQMDVKRMRQILGQSGQLDRINSELLEQKALDFLVEHAKIEDVEAPEEA